MHVPCVLCVNAPDIDEHIIETVKNVWTQTKDETELIIGVTRTNLLDSRFPPLTLVTVELGR